MNKLLRLIWIWLDYHKRGNQAYLDMIEKDFEKELIRLIKLHSVSQNNQEKDDGK